MDLIDWLRILQDDPNKEMLDLKIRVLLKMLTLVPFCGLIVKSEESMPSFQVADATRSTYLRGLFAFFPSIREGLPGL